MNNNILVADNLNLRLSLSKKKTYLFIKRCLDIIIAIIGIFFLIPLVFIVKISYILTGDFKTIFFIQERIGINGKKFKMFKFRTMVPNAQNKLDKLLNEDIKAREEYDKYKKITDDPRVTKAGKFFRKTSIDEFPQFINVFIGNMSVVGPRPYLDREIKDMGSYYKNVIMCKPGITGYWQANGRNDLDFHDRLLCDEYYSKKMGIKFDMRIFFATFSKVLKRNGAK